MRVIAKGGAALVQTLTSPPSRGASVSPAPAVLRMAELLERSRSRLPPRPYTGSPVATTPTGPRPSGRAPKGYTR